LLSRPSSRGFNRASQSVVWGSGGGSSTIILPGHLLAAPGLPGSQRPHPGCSRNCRFAFGKHTAAILLNCRQRRRNPEVYIGSSRLEMDRSNLSRRVRRLAAGGGQPDLKQPADPRVGGGYPGGRSAGRQRQSRSCCRTAAKSPCRPVLGGQARCDSQERFLEVSPCKAPSRRPIGQPTCPPIPVRWGGTGQPLAANPPAPSTSRQQTV